jgi:predicted nucleotidyltransferase
MEKKIKKYLKDIEEKFDITILLACETGSRAWGFPSPDSDYDVRLIYKHEKDWYLSLAEEKDTIEMMLDDNEIDISGWDIRKALRLLWKSNPPLLERIQSPITYICDDSFLLEMNSIANNVYSRIATIHHYLSMSKNCFSEIDQKESFKLKKLFYALRSSIACKWILERDEIPPISFTKMFNGLEFSNEIKEKIFDLIELKAQKDESYYHSGENGLFILIEELIADADLRAKHLPAGNGNFEALNDFFKKAIN